MKRHRKSTEDVMGHPSEEHRDFHPRDRRLRRFGFFILSRPRNGFSLWGLERSAHGCPMTTFTEPEAHEYIDKHEKDPERRWSQ